MAKEQALNEIEILEVVPDITTVHHVEPDGTAWGTRGRSILRFKGSRWEVVARLPFLWPRDFFHWSRPAARLMRSDRANLYVNRRGHLLALRGGVAYRLDASAVLQPIGSIHGDCVLQRGICEDEDGACYFGEYAIDPRADEIKVWQVSANLSEMRVAHAFERGSILHVHGVHRDPYDPEALWLSVGDFEGQCHLYRSRDGLRTLDRFGDGGQAWRAVSLLFTREHVCWITDSEFDQNYACRMRRRDGDLEIGEKVSCSSWYAATTSDGLHVAFTTVEAGPAIQRKESSLLVSHDAFHWREVASFEKDAWIPYRAFKHGVISCPSGSMESSNFFISGEALRGLDGISMRLDLSGARR